MILLSTGFYSNLCISTMLLSRVNPWRSEIYKWYGAKSNKINTPVAFALPAQVKEHRSK